ncbi:Fc.00g045090.m01.CDS01 [Cosmosporella sp. VM-42]
MPSLSKIAVALAIGAFASADAKVCPPLGAVLPAPQTPSKSQVVKDAVSKLKGVLDESSSVLNTSAVSINLKSIHENKPLFTYHYTPPNPGSGKTTIDQDTIYRIASGTKLFTVLAALQSNNVNMTDPVLKYLPELKNTTTDSEIAQIPWEDITVESLAAHLSGLGVDMAQDLGIIGSDPWQKLGLPAFPKGKGPDCSGLPGTKPCTREQLLAEVNRRPPVYQPYTNPIYSNIGLALLGYVVEAAEGKPFPQVLQDSIFDVLGLNGTSIGKVPSSDDIFIPVGDTVWNATLGAFDAAGGLYSTPADMLAFAEGIMTYKFLTPLETHQWMKPASSTASWGYLVGRPWEILRSDNLTKDGRLIDVYTKSGDLGLYHTLTGLIPDYDVVISVLMGGVEVSSSPYISSTIFGDVLQALLPAIEKAGRDEAKMNLLGEFADESSNSSIIFTQDSGPGLLISNWTVRGFDVLHSLPKYSFDALESGEDLGDVPVEARVYPTNLLTDNKRAWRAVFDFTTEEQREEVDNTLFFKDGSCQTWFQQDRKVYNYKSLDEFVFLTEDGKSEVKAVENLGFNVTLIKVSGPQDDGEPQNDEPQNDGDKKTTSGATFSKNSNVALVTILGASLVLLNLF